VTATQAAAPAPAPAVAPFNTLAIVSIIAAFLLPLIGIITGHISLSQIKKRGERGHGLALAGTIIGYVNLVVSTIVGILIVVGLLAAANAVSATSDTIGACVELTTAVAEQETELAGDFTLMLEDPAAATESLDRISGVFYDASLNIDNAEVKAIAESLSSNVSGLSAAVAAGDDTDPWASAIVDDIDDFQGACIPQ
jgi:hypothetical protein